MERWTRLVAWTVGGGRDGKARRASERGFGCGNLGTAYVSALARGGREKERLREPRIFYFFCLFLNFFTNMFLEVRFQNLDL